MLVDGWREAGAHEVTFDGSKLASGIYLYTANFRTERSNRKNGAVEVVTAAHLYFGGAVELLKKIILLGIFASLIGSQASARFSGTLKELPCEQEYTAITYFYTAQINSGETYTVWVDSRGDVPAVYLSEVRCLGQSSLDA